MFPNGFDFLMLAIATWRIAVFFVREDGPWHIARWVRERVGIVHDDTGEPVGYPETTAAQAMSCVWCMSFWLAPVVLALWLSGPGVVVVLLVAMAGGAALLDVAVGGAQR